MQIKLLVAVGNGEILSLELSQGLWVEDNSSAHWQIDCLINEAMRRAQEDLDYQNWLVSGPVRSVVITPEWKISA